MTKSISMILLESRGSPHDREFFKATSIVCNSNTIAQVAAKFSAMWNASKSYTT